MKNHKIPDDMIAGTIHKTKMCGDLFILEYKTSKRVNVCFKSTGYDTYSDSTQIRNGKVKDRLLPCVFGIGFIGLGSHKATKNKRMTKQYQVWHSMLRRCYCEVFHKRQPTYAGCSVDPVWHNFQNFAKWFDQSYINGCEIDKDILHQGNKVYSPENCLFVSRQINMLLSDNQASRGTLKIGVYFSKASMAYTSSSNSNGKNIHLGTFNTEEAAHQAYKKYKYAVIAEVASKQTEPLRSALLAYRIE